MGKCYSGHSTWSFLLIAEASLFAHRVLFYESARAARESAPAVRETLEQLDLNYFIPCQISRTLARCRAGHG